MVFTTRAGGVSASPYDSFNLAHHVGDDPAAVAANRARLADSLGQATDAVVTTTPGLALAVLVADCVPLLLADHVNGVVAAVHAGRMGAGNGIVPATVAKMVELGAQPSGIHAVMGAAASGLNYEVPQEMADDVERRLPGSRTRTRQGTWGLDVRAGLIRQLMSLGVTAIESDPRCTIEDEDFFSYRRQGTTGRQAGVVWLNP